MTYGDLAKIEAERERRTVLIVGIGIGMLGSAVIGLIVMFGVR